MEDIGKVKVTESKDPIGGVMVLDKRVSSSSEMQ